jgi:peptidyl-prolyl cis-trans isomerase A (cyclophilin A)
MRSPSVVVARSVLFAITACALVACENKAPEIVGKDPTPAGSTATEATTAPAPPPKPATSQEAANGPIDLKTALDGITGTGDLLADIDVNPGGKVTCKLYDDKAPTTVANFVGLARGLQSFKDPMTQTWTKRPAYDGTTFHRIVKGFMIQGGDPAGTGTGDPGYVIPDEIWPGSKHDRAGLLCMANRGKNTNGMQFFITDDLAPHLDGNYTIFGECTPLATIHGIASTPVGPNGETPVLKPKILSVKIHRAKP